jgi:hypothetical protein
MNLRAVAIPAVLSILCGFALAVPAAACPLQTAEKSSPVVLAAEDMEDEAVEKDLRPDEVPAGEEAAPPKGSAEADHGTHEKSTDLETEEIQKDMAPDTVPAGE